MNRINHQKENRTPGNSFGEVKFIASEIVGAPSWSSIMYTAKKLFQIIL